MVGPVHKDILNEFLGGVSTFQSVQDGVNESYIIRSKYGKNYFLKIGTNPNSSLETEMWVIKKIKDSVPVPDIYLSITGRLSLVQ